MRNLRCWLLGHDWIPTHFERVDIFQQHTRMAYCYRCETTIAFERDEEDAAEGGETDA